MFKHSRTNEYLYNNNNNVSSENSQNNSYTGKSHTPFKSGPTVNVYEKDYKNMNKSLSPHSKGEAYHNKNMITTTATTTTTTTTTTTMTTNIQLPIESNIEIVYNKSPFKKTKEEVIATPPKKSKVMSGVKAAQEILTSSKQPASFTNKINNSSTGKLKSKANAKPNVMNPNASGANNRYMISYYNSKHSNSGHSSASGMSGQDNTHILNPTNNQNFTNSNNHNHTNNDSSGSKSNNISKNNSSHSMGSPEITFNVSRVISGTPNSNRGMKKLKLELPNHEPTKFSFKKNGVVKAYAVNTNQGIVRNYNEDRVSIILNIMKPIDRQNEFWPRCSFFGVYDGHGGVTCADFLRDNLHHFVIKDENFPYNPKEALKGGFYEAEHQFCELAQKNSLKNEAPTNNNNNGNSLNEENSHAQEKTEIKNTPSFDKSGSCCIALLIVGDTCYVANVGDSRAVMSVELGRKAIQLSRDHKPLDEIEYKRIAEAGGKIYQTKVQTYNNSTLNDSNTSASSEAYLVGPYRVLPGRLSVTRTFGDIEAKLPHLGGNPNVVIATPDITYFKVCEEHDFIIIASDGIYDKLSTKEVIDIVWNSTRENLGDNIHQVCANAVEQIMKTAIAKRTVDNITVVMIAFSSFKNFLFPKRIEMIGHSSLDNINMGHKQFLDNSLIGNNSFDLDNRSFSLGEELNIINLEVKPNFQNENGQKNNMVSNSNNMNNNNSKMLANKRNNNVLKKKTVVGMATGTTAKPGLTSNNFRNPEKGKNILTGNALCKNIVHKSDVKKNEISSTSRGLTKNLETFYKKK